jgi:hypothetical protein
MDSTRDGTRPPMARIARRIGVPSLGVLVNRPPLTRFALAVLFVELVVGQAVNVALGYPVFFVDNPLALLLSVMLLGAAEATHALHRRYDRALERSVLANAEDPETFRTLVPDWLPVLVVGPGVLFTVVNGLLFITVPVLYEAGGPVRVFRVFVVQAFGYVPVFGSFLATYLSIQVLLPRRLERHEVDLDYLDPENLGGTRPIGELLKFSYYLLMVGLVIAVVGTYGPYLLPGPLRYTELGAPGAEVNAIFTAVWLVSVLVMVYGIYVVHRYMAAEKKRRIHELTDRVRDELDGPWNIESFDMLDPPDEYQQYRRQVERVVSMQEYPATFTMWSQLAVGVVIPKAVQVLLSSL